MPIQWKTDLSLGVPTLDAQHRELDGHLATVHDALCEGRVPDLAAILERIRAWTGRHFDAEEEYLARAGAPVEEHRARHQEFRERLDGFVRTAAREGATMPLAMEIGNWLVGWVRDHQRYDLQVAARAPGTGPAARKDEP